jgi:hypothetical protein
VKLIGNHLFGVLLETKTIWLHLQGNGTDFEENFENRPLSFDRAPQKMAKSKISAAMVRPYRRYDHLKIVISHTKLSKHTNEMFTKLKLIAEQLLS